MEMKGEPVQLTLTLGESKADFQTVGFVLFINVFHKGLEVFNRFIRFFGFSCFGAHDDVLYISSSTIITHYRREHHRYESGVR